MMASLYSQSVVEHARHPHHAQPVDGPTHQSETVNRSCGDRVVVTVRAAGDRIIDVGIASEGCALTTAGGSLLADHLIGKSLDEARAIDEATVLHLAGDISPSPSRLQCLLLGYRAVQQALKTDSV